MLTSLLAQLQNERERWLLWVPVAFGVGCFLYFLLPFEPSTRTTGAMLSLSCTAAWLCYRRLFIIFLPILALTIISIGFAVAHFHTISSKNIRLEEKLPPTWVRGVIKDIDTLQHGHRIILEDVDIWKYPPEKNPESIRINIRTDMNGAEPGDYVSVRAALNPPPRPVYPGGYDFSFYTYFRHIGAVGYSVTPVYIKEKSRNPSFITTIRHYVTTRIYEALTDGEKSRAAHIATSMLTGERAGLDKATKETMRAAGIGHLLAISGLHLVLVCITLFAAIRAVFALIPPLALRYNIKKLAAILALCGGLIYLLLAGAPVSAQRAYVMVVLFFLCILWDRTATPMRPVAWAAMVVLLIAPHSITGPSFQMSFAAVTALIAAYEVARAKRWFYPKHHSVLHKPIIYFASVVFSSLIAGLATAPYSISHFGAYAAYGILGNLLAVPLASIVVMPLGVAGLVMVPFGFEYPFLWLMGQAIEAMLYYAEFISALPHSSLSIPTLQGMPLLLITSGGLWLCIWTKKVRLLGIAPIIAGIILSYSYVKPDIIVDASGKMFAVRNSDGELLFSSKTYARYARKQWLQSYGQTSAEKISSKKANTDNIKCDEDLCIYTANGKKAVIALPSYSGNAETMQQYCNSVAIFIIPHTNLYPCREKYVITKDILERMGTHTIWLGENMRVETVEGIRKNRLWTGNH